MVVPLSLLILLHLYLWFDADEQRIVERQNQAFRIESDEEQLSPDI